MMAKARETQTGTAFYLGLSRRATTYRRETRGPLKRKACGGFFTAERFYNSARGRAAHPGNGPRPFPYPEGVAQRLVQPLRGIEEIQIPCCVPGVRCATPG